MIQILMSLEPRFETAGTTILEELQEINEIIFISKGKVAVGFEINKKKEFALTFNDKVVIGAYNCTFKKRANYCFYCLSFCEGYSLRKASWLESLDNFPEIAIAVRQNVVTEYKNKIMMRMEKSKRELINRMRKRHDFDKISVLVSNKSDN